MRITNQYGTVNYNLDLIKFKRLGLSFSGGCDSTLLMYLTLKMIEEKKSDSVIVPITGINLSKGLWKLESSQEILDRLFMMFPVASKQVTKRYINYNWTQKEYGKFVQTLARDKIIDIRLFALTANPPYSVMEQHDLLREREILRDGQGIEFIQTPDGLIYDVFRNIDKRWIAECYDQFDLMDDIYPLTVSCERLRNTPEMLNDKTPCKQCWWCREKKMAFGVYDGFGHQ